MSDYEPEPVDYDDGTDHDDSEAAGTGPEDLIAAFPRWLPVDEVQAYAEWFVEQHA